MPVAGCRGSSESAQAEGVRRFEKRLQIQVACFEQTVPVGIGPRIADDDGFNAGGMRGLKPGEGIFEDERLGGADAERAERKLVDLGIGLDAADVLSRQDGVKKLLERKLGSNVRIRIRVDVDAWRASSWWLSQA